jgi:hypothetical protein
MSVGVYNVLNLANFDLPGNALNGLLTGTAGQINGTNAPSHNMGRVGVGTDVYSLGAPRQIEFGASSDLLDGSIIFFRDDALEQYEQLDVVKLT